MGESAAVGWGVGTAMLQEASDPDPDGLGKANPDPFVISAPSPGSASLLRRARAVRGLLAVLGDTLAAPDSPENVCDSDEAELAGESKRPVPPLLEEPDPDDSPLCDPTWDLPLAGWVAVRLPKKGDPCEWGPVEVGD